MPTTDPLRQLAGTGGQLSDSWVIPGRPQPTGA
ncbi:MAG: hypothetical protein QOI42_749 [Frankiaceae bacterium]|jgi:hypothetical protein|nr:hypothetical protein [Frankiaceae bacterium]